MNVNWGLKLIVRALPFCKRMKRGVQILLLRKDV